MQLNEPLQQEISAILFLCLFYKTYGKFSLSDKILPRNYTSFYRYLSVFFKKIPITES
jgi:hypothetical protein